MRLIPISQEMQEREAEIGDEEEDLWYLRRLDSGLFTLQTVDYILAWVAMEDDGVRRASRVPYFIPINGSQIRSHIQQMLGRRNKSLKDIVRTLQIFYNNVNDVPEADGDGQLSQRDILKNLMSFLNAC